jgi:tRNA 2-thiouridine synthesizing protein A
MTLQVLNTMGMKCPMPILKLAVKAAYMNEGDVLEIRGDCPTLERDVRAWCDRLHKVLLAINLEEDNKKKIQIRF